MNDFFIFCYCCLLALLEFVKILGCHKSVSQGKYSVISWIWISTKRETSTCWKVFSRPGIPSTKQIWYLGICSDFFRCRSSWDTFSTLYVGIVFYGFSELFQIWIVSKIFSISVTLEIKKILICLSGVRR